jgi:hypothetical protein
LSSSRNLLSKDDCRAALAYEVAEMGPEVAFVCESFLLARCGEWLAGTRAGPERSIIRDASEPESSTPATEAGKEMALLESGKVSRSNIDN